jgi:hypothetical protein
MMKYKINTYEVDEGMQFLRALDGVKTVTLNSLREDGLTRTETDNLMNEEYEFSLNAIFIIAHALSKQPISLIADPGELNLHLSQVSEEKLTAPEEIIDGDPDHTFGRIQSSKKTFLLETLDSDTLKSQYSNAGDSLNSEHTSSTRVEREQRSFDEQRVFEFGDHLANKTSWINAVEPEVIIANKEALELFQEQIEEYTDLKRNNLRKTGSLSELLKHSESAVKANNIDLKTVGEDYRIFYKAVSRELLIEEQAIIGHDFDPDYPVYDQYHSKPRYKFKYRPVLVEHFFIIAPSDPEHFLLTAFNAFKEKHIFDISKEQTPKWAADIWWTQWNQVGEIRGEDDGEDIPF